MTGERDVLHDTHPADLIADIKAYDQTIIEPQRPAFKDWFHIIATNYSPHGTYRVYEKPIPQINSTFIVRVEEDCPNQKVFVDIIDGPGLNDLLTGRHGGTTVYFDALEELRTDAREASEHEVDLIYQATLSAIPENPQQS